MVQANPTPSSGGNKPRVRHIPIGEDHLGFKNDPQIQNQLDSNGKCLLAHKSPNQRTHRLSRDPRSRSADTSRYTHNAHRGIIRLSLILRLAQLALTQCWMTLIVPFFCFAPEHIVFSCQVLKYNRFGMKQTRFLLLTTHQISNVKDKGKSSNRSRSQSSFDRASLHSSRCVHFEPARRSLSQSSGQQTYDGVITCSHVLLLQLPAGFANQLFCPCSLPEEY